MSLMKQACETYDYAEHEYAGQYYADKKEPLAPIGHMITKASIEIMLTKDGKFLSANKPAKDDEKTIFPVTEESAGRTNKPVPHPLCEQLQYLIPFDNGDEKKHSLYLEQLSQWEQSPYSHPILTGVLNYVKKGMLLQDLSNAGLIDSYDKHEKDFVRWRVTGIEEENACWKNIKLHKAYIEWYRSIQTGQTDICMVSGIESVQAKQHAKGVVSLNGNAKIISANDSSGFTYRGRFFSDNEALSISYETSQKAHNALRWIVANNGDYHGGRCFVCWNPQGKDLPRATSGIMARRREGLKPTYTPLTYREQLHRTLLSWKNDFPTDAKAITAVFDAATTGRLSIIYYSEIQAADFIDRLGYWDETCCWPYEDFGIQSPPLEKIATYAFGTFRSGGFEADERILKQVMMQLLASRVEKALFPINIEKSLVQRAGNLQIIPDDENNHFLRRSLLYTTCSVIRKYYIDHQKEEWSMALDPTSNSRSYQFGRWMAIMEKIEKDTYDKEDKRETNIIRRQLAYCSRPYATAVSVMGHLKVAYYPQLSVGTRAFYEKQIEGIMEVLSEDPSSLNKPLSDIYLLGYYLQKKALYTTKKEETEE